MKIKIIAKEEFLPKYETMGSAGMDLKADIEADIVLKAGERRLIATGISIELPIGLEGQVRARSGLAVKHGIGLVNGLGTIDSDYRGEIKVPLINLGQVDFKIERGMRIAQLVVAKYERITWEPVENLEDSTRGEGGFGHTGI